MKTMADYFTRPFKRQPHMECDACGEMLDQNELEEYGGYLICDSCYARIEHVIDEIEDLPYELDSLFWNTVKEFYGVRLGVKEPPNKRDTSPIVCSGCGDSIGDGNEYMGLGKDKYCTHCAAECIRVVGETNTERNT